MIRCLAFDFDGTIVDSNEIKRRTFFEIASDVDPHGEVVAKILEDTPGDRHDIMRELVAGLARRGALPDDTTPEELARRWVADYSTRCERAVSECAEIRGAGEALAVLAERGLALFLNTATPRDAVLPILRRRGLARFFQGVYGRPASKVDNLMRIGERAGAGADQLVFVGDGEDDRVAAVEFGCAFVGVAPAGNGRFAQEPERVLPDLVGLPALVAGLNGLPA